MPGRPSAGRELRRSSGVESPRSDQELPGVEGRLPPRPEAVLPRPAPAPPVLGFPLFERSPPGLRGPFEPDRSGVGLFTAPSCPPALHERKDLYLKTTTPRGTEAPRGVLYVRRCPTLPQVPTCSTIGAERLSFRVRNGAGRFPFAMITETLWSYDGPHPHEERRLPTVTREPHSGRVTSL